ncbi:uncharacterized protein LOC121971716 [Zingiber officinale]|uniref:uncharacterized protein LOC121971716 n=1 Tax=Zingiber officinale TaxID=94328 RepID=UPI001C4DBF83|nr:uncharacterized protein LOC121971716 [Zingiber officinale]
MVSLQTAISPAEEEEEKPCVELESRMVTRKRKSPAVEACKSAKKAREEEKGGVMELNLLDAHPEIKSEVDPRAMKVSLNLDLELNLSSTQSETGCVSKGEEKEEDEVKRTTEEEIEEMVATVCMRCHMLVMMTKVALSCPNCKFVHAPDQSSSLALIKSV